VDRINDNYFNREWVYIHNNPSYEYLYVCNTYYYRNNDNGRIHYVSTQDYKGE